MSNRTKLPGWLARAGLVMLAFAAMSCGDDNPSNPPTTGSIQVTATTTGAELDADGYTVSVDGGAGQALAINGSVTISNQAAGSHDVELGGVAANCTVAGDNPTSVTVTAGSTATASFTITCSATAGAIEVTTVSTGDDIDADGYTVSVDGGAGQAIGANGTHTFSGLDAGDHAIELAGVAANCTVGGDNPRTVAVTAGATAPTQFDVTCTALPGDLKVVNVTSGDNTDDAYTVSIDGGAAQALAANDSLTVTALDVGDHTVELGDVAANCTVGGNNPRTVAVTSGSEVRTQFDVTCQTSGGLDVTTSTWGLNLDADGYSLVVDGGAPQAIGVDETLNLQLSAGDHSVQLAGLASNCTVQNGTNPRTETVVDGSTVATQFDVFCWQTLQNQVVFETNRDGNNEIYVRIPGGAVSNMTINSALDENPSVSSDGNAIVFDTNRDGALSVWRMDGSGFTKLTSSGTEFDPSYTGLAGSRQIAFVKRSSGDDQIWIMNNDGINRQLIAATASFDNFHPSFSPDGNWILFASNRDGNDEIYVVNVNTLTQTRLTVDGGTDAKPAWWYDGSRILWVSNRSGNFDVWAADFDSVTPAISNLENLTNDPQGDFMPAMRPDGGAIALVRDGTGFQDIYTVDPDGSNPVPLFVTNFNDLNPAWSPWTP